MDYNTLRAQAVETGDDEAVTVNTRDLIDKILSRYAREWSTLRELIQNAADAAATRVIIKIETRPSVKIPSPKTDDPSTRLRHVIQNHTIDKWIVENNGHKFKPEDWARLKEIAKGNPDETKIGAFGVGFYSVFSTSENPFVTSGSEALEFYWKGDALFTRRFQHGMGQSTDTVFILPMRDETSPVPQAEELLTLCQFLTGSMTFVGLESIELYIDEWRFLRLQKSIPGPVNIDIPASVHQTTTDGLMRISKVVQDAIQLRAEWMSALQWATSLRSGRGIDVALEPAKKKLTSFFNKGFKALSQNSEKPAQDVTKVQSTIMEDFTSVSEQKVFYHVNRATINTTVGRKLSAEFQRSRKKNPPKTTTVSFLSQSYDERAASSTEQATMASKLFETVAPTTGGHIYIGFQTSQTTGVGAHLSIPSIVPTVEREQIDLTSNQISTWNIELLRAAGIIARISWSIAMVDIQRRQGKLTSIAQGKSFEKEELDHVVPVVEFLYEGFDWKSTTPRDDVGEYIEQAFWRCSREFEILSSRGIVPYKNVRIASVDMSFIEELPIVPESLLKAGLIKALRAGGDLTEVQTEDIVWTLEKSKRTRTPLETVSGDIPASDTVLTRSQRKLLEYIASKARSNTISREEIRSILSVAVTTDDDEEPTRIIALGQMKDFVDPNKIPPDTPVPPSTIPFKYTKALSKFDTDALGFKELSVLKWVQWLVEDPGSKHDIETNAAFASSVLKILSKNWPGLSTETRMAVADLLENRTILPTKMGLKRPSDSYFSSVKLFDDLPVIQDLPNVKEPFLIALGVRKTLEIGVVLDRLMGGSNQADKPGSKWSHVDLIKYLVAVWADVPERDRTRLRNTSICPSREKPDEQLFRVSDLYEPSDPLRRLGLPTLQWPGTYLPESREGKLLRTLGLRDAPTYTDLVHIIATAGQSANIALRDFGIRYLIENYQSKRYDLAVVADVKTPFLPVQGSESKLSVPLECYTNERAAFLGFDLLRSHLHQYASQLGVQSDPPIERCIRRLVRNPPQNKRQARQVFGYMTSRLISMTDSHVDTLGSAKIVPLSPDKGNAGMKGSGARYSTPRMCFLGDGGDFANVFDFVDFGPEANMFLVRCGSKNEPSPPEIARLLTQRPAKFLDELDVPKYMEVLVRVSKAWDTLKKDDSLVQAMRQAPFLLASKEVATENVDDNQEDEEEGAAKIWQLARASDTIIIGDDIINFQLFKSAVLAAPQQDETLEDLYIHLGASTLGSLIEERQKFGELTSDQSTAVKLQSIIHERARLYLHQTPKESIRHDAKWVEKNVTVQAVRSIVVRTSLKGQDVKHTQSRTATLHKDVSHAWVIYITNNYEIWDVSQVLANLLLRRSKPGDAMMLETILRSELRSLQKKGLNIDKILRQKEREAKIAKEMHQQQLEQEYQIRAEQEVLQQQGDAQRAAGSQEKDRMPGDFPNSKDNNPHEVEEYQETGGFFTDALKKWGFDLGRRPPPTTTHEERQGNGNHPGLQHDDFDDPARPVREPETTKPTRQAPSTNPPSGPITPGELNKEIQTAIHSSRPHKYSTLQSQPSVHKVEEIHTTCDVKPGMNILHVGDISSMRVFIDDEIKVGKEQFMMANQEGLKYFASVLQDCATVYGVPRESVHIFCDKESPTIAFNKANSLFFNYRIFGDEHLEMMRKANRDEPVRKWAVHMAHELAHNIESDHNIHFHNIMGGLFANHVHPIAQLAGATLPPTVPAARSTSAQQPPPSRGPTSKTPSNTAAMKGTFTGAFKR
ncbi:MAG: hypothetical protein Q9219_002240 [cf. Caloplaca sp. 3 TL-2023]